MENTKELIKNKAFILNVIIIVLEIIGIAISYHNGGIKNLVYYTVDSNILALISCVLFVIVMMQGRKSKFVSMLRYIATVNLALTFTIVVFVFVPMCIPYGYDAVAEILYRGAQWSHHLLCPLFSMISFVLFEKSDILFENRHDIEKKNSKIATVFTFAYAIVLVILNICKVVRGPYPFLLVYEQPVWTSVLWFIGIVLVAYGYSLLIGKLYRMRRG